MTTTGDFRQIYRAMTTPQLVSEAWDRDTNKMVRDVVVGLMTEREAGGDVAAWPSGLMAERETMAGLYPDPDDPQFAARLFSKREFYEARAVAASIQDGTLDPCNSTAAEAVFELTPVQRLVSRFMHPLTPYMGMLLFHGVGVGKTCSGVTIAEQFLEQAPNTKVILLVPQAIQENFKKTIFDVSKLRWDDAKGEWATRQCTGTSYLERLGLMKVKDLKSIQFQVDNERRRRYTITGYQAFANWIERTLRDQIPAGLTDPTARAVAENDILRRLFSDHLIIIDEAHNMRDSEGGAAVAMATLGDAEAPVAGEAAENAGGKALHPYLKRILLHAEGLRLVLMSATPMYNSAPEIVQLLNYLLMNDMKTEKGLLVRDELFTKEGDLRPGAVTTPLERAARRYVSYMRGENPFTFPIRMRPEAAAAKPAELWPTISAAKNPVTLTEQDVASINAMPLVFTEPTPGSPPEVMLRTTTRRAEQREKVPILGTEGKEGEVEGEGVGAEAPVPVTDAMLDLRMQMANITYPNSLYGTSGWDNYFSKQTVTTPIRKLRVFAPKTQSDGVFNVDTVFSGDGLHLHAPKIHRVVQSIQNAKGICFVYSRYIKSGALPIAVALERMGYQRKMADGKVVPLLMGVSAVPRACALCEKNEKTHAADAEHPFKPAYYVLLTSESDISPEFAGLVQQASSWSAEDPWGPMGTNVKVVIGSQVASEGLDLKCIREMHILDAWYHLNRTDQIIGRAIRYCSHTALRSVEKWGNLPTLSLNNCLIYLHALRVPDFETADMYAYRLAIRKAQAVGRVQRLLKRYAWDCNLEMEAIVFAGLPERMQIDAQGRHLESYSVDDQDYTTYCDYQVCKHECAISVPRSEEEGLQIDSSTFRAEDARRILLAKQDIVRRLFEDQLIVPESVVQEVFADLPWEIRSEVLMEMIDGRKFRVKRPDGMEGFLIKKAGYIVFQPAAIADTDIPMTMRYARAFQLRRKFLEPKLPVFRRAEEPGAIAPIVKAKAPVAVAAPAEEGKAMEGKTAEEQEAAMIVAGVPVAAAAAPETNGVYGKWQKWLAYVNSKGRGEAPFPSPKVSPMRIWSWMLDHFSALPETKYVALRWWFEKYIGYPERRALYEYILTNDNATTDPELYDMMRKDIMKTSEVVAYRIYNPEKQDTEIWCQGVGSTDFAQCPSNVANAVNKALGNKPVAIPDETGALVGFLTAKTGKLVFKTLDTTKPKKHSSVGAECGNTSNLGEHHPRIRLLHEAARSQDAMRPLIIQDDDAWDAEDKATKERIKTGRPTHMKDITHQPLCIYMEFLTRLLDARKVRAKRWFLDAVDAFQSGLKGKGGK